jgi:hypothetical protein
MSSSRKKSHFRKLNIESLEARRVMTLPFGAEPSDLGEFMLGRVSVTPVLLESTGETSTEDWTQEHVNEVEQNIREGLQWWKDLLATKSSLHSLDWVIDTTYIQNRLPIDNEPIAQISNEYINWVPKFLRQVGFSSSTDLAQNIRSFNNSQRLKNNTDWSFTIFVVNSKNDSDGSFLSGGSFTRAFAFAGGLFQVVPSTRPASTFAHETGHMFWARDEYSGGSNAGLRRGYYDSLNKNAIDGNVPGFVQEPSIMSAGSNLQFAYENLVTSSHSLAQIGWVDSDGDQIFDVLDVPLKLAGTGRISVDGNRYRFVGKASTQTLPNLNSSGNQNNITLNKVDRIQYRINGGNWVDYSNPEAYTVDLNLDIPLSVSQGTIEIRAINNQLGITSNVFLGQIGPVPDVTTDVGIHGFLWEDSNQNGQWSRNEFGLSGVTIAVVGNNDQPLPLQDKLEPDDFPPGEIETDQAGFRVDVIGDLTNSRVAVGTDALASSGQRIFKPVAGNGTILDVFRDDDQQLRVRFDTATSFASIDAIAFIDNTDVRLEAFDADGKLLVRSERKGMIAGQKQVLEVGLQQNNISYVIARAFGGSSVKFDRFLYGSSSTAVTASDGSYRFPYLPVDNYRLKVIGLPNDSTNTSPANGIQNVQLTAGATVKHVDFGVHLAQSPWKNPRDQNDVDNSGVVTPLDVLVLINEINARGARNLDGSGLSFPPYYDPNGDRALSSLDVLQIINFLNNRSNPPRSGGEGSDTSDQVPEVFSSYVFDQMAAMPTTWIVQSSESSWQLAGETELDLFGCNHDHSAEIFEERESVESTVVPVTLPSTPNASEQVFQNLGESCCCPNCAISGEGELVINLKIDPNAPCTKSSS